MYHLHTLNIFSEDDSPARFLWDMLTELPFLFTAGGLIYSSLGLSSPGLQKSLSLTINLHHARFLSAVTDDLPFNSRHPVKETRRQFSAVSAEYPGKVTPAVMMVTVCVCVFLIILASRK